MNGALKRIGRLVNGLSLASYELDTLVYRAKPIEQLASVVVTNLLADTAYRIDFKSVLDYPIRLTLIKGELTGIASHELLTGGTVSSAFSNAVYLWEISRATGEVLTKAQFALSGGYGAGNGVILNSTNIYDIRINSEFNRIAFIGEPIYLKNELVVTNKLEKPTA